MAFTLQRGRGVGAEIRRLLDHHLGAAVDALASPRPDVSGARRHIKKARTLLQLERPASAATTMRIAGRRWRLREAVRIQFRTQEGMDLHRAAS